MASFSRMSRWPVGYFRAFSRWLLNQRRGVPQRVDTLNAEIERIGFVTVGYRSIVGEDGSVTKTEERVGFSVTEGSNLARLVQAYIANGGNPFDIAPFWMPGQTRAEFDAQGNLIRVESYPYGGLLSMRSADPSDPKPVVTVDDEGNEVTTTTGFGGYPGGNVNSGEVDYSQRVGTRAPVRDLDMVRVMRKMRDWANQDIREQLTRIEWAIIKQMDLREQLSQERDDILAQALGGLNFNSQRTNSALTLQSLVQDMYEMIYEIDDGKVKAYRAGPDVDLLDFTFEDLPSEVGRDPLG